MKRAIGSTGVEVNPIGLGAWQLSNRGRPGDEQGAEVVRSAIEAGVELIDTADCYCADDEEFGHNERIVRAGVEKAGRKDVQVATKVGFRRPGGAWRADGRPERIARCCDESLRRLGVETLFLYQLHTPDPKVPIEETVGAMRALQEAGKVLHLGLSNVDRSLLERALAVARIETVQNECNPWASRDVGSGLVGFCAEHGIGYLPYHPVGGKERHTALAESSVLKRLATRHRTSTYCVLLAWLLGLGKHVIPIPGASRVASIVDSLCASRVVLEEEEREALAAAAQ